MALPQLSEEARKEALAKAAAARSARAELRRKVKSGELPIVQALEMKDDPVAGKIKVATLLESLPGYGKARVGALMEGLKIDPSRRVKGLGEIQRAALIEHFS